MRQIKLTGVIFLGVIILLQFFLQGCSGIERRVDLTTKKKLLPMQNAFQFKKILDQKITNLNSEYTLNSAILLSSGDNNLFTADTVGNVIVSNLSGKVLWKKSLPHGNKITAGPVYVQEKILVASDDARLFCLDSKNGDILWNSEISSNSLAKPVVNDNVVFVHTLDGGLTALSLLNGKQLWRISTVTPSLTLHRNSSPVIFNDYVITGFANGKLFAINKDSGAVLWSYNISHPQGKLDLERITDIVADPIVSHDVVYAISYQGNLVSIKLEDGKLIWEKELSSYSGFILEQQNLLVVAKSGDIISIDAKTGNTLWEQNELEGRALSTPVKYGRYLVVGDQEGYIHVLDLKTGFIKGRILLKHAGISIAPKINASGQLQILTDDGYLVILEILE